MLYYHGTTLDKALQIFKKERLKGRRIFDDHKHGYVSLSLSRATSRYFGEVLLSFNCIQTEMSEVKYGEREWIKDNIEIMEYVYGGKLDKNNINYEFIELNGEREFVVRDELKLEETKLEEIILFSPTEEEAEGMREEIEKVISITIPFSFMQEPKEGAYEYWTMLEYLQEK